MTLHKFLTPVCASSLLLLTACPPPNEGNTTETESETDTETETETETTAGPTTSTTPTTTTNTETTTEDPTTEDPTTEDPTTEDPTTEDPTVCGNGMLEDGEECDGEDDCTDDCKLNVCGDGVALGDEACDDGDANGSYNSCNADCSGQGPSCGDGNVDVPDEQCEGDDPQTGCIASTCQMAPDCAELKAEYSLEAESTGPYSIRPANFEENVAVHCDMSGGWTYVKTGGMKKSAAQAAAMCNETFGLDLFYPGSEEHLLSAIGVAMNAEVLPALEAELAPADPKYLQVMAIYPTVPGESCAGAALNSNACPQWQPLDSGAWWITADSLSESQPGTSNCDGCSMAYQVDGEEMTVIGYESFMNAGKGATSELFLCRAP